MGGGGLGGGALAMGGGGLGIVGVILYLVIGALGGGGGGSLGQLGGVPGSTQVSDTGESREELSRRCNAEGGIDKYDDCFLIKVYNEINEVWADELGRRGES